MDLEPEGKVFVVITLTGSFTEGKDKFWIFLVQVSSYSERISNMEIIKRAFCKRRCKFFFMLGGLVFCF